MIRRPPRSTLSSSSAASDVYKRQSMKRILSAKQLQMILIQLRKVCNHPRQLLAKIKGNNTQIPLHHPALTGDDELRGLKGEELVTASGKLQVVDKLLMRMKAQGSRVLLFSFFVETLDILSEFCHCLLYTSPSPRDS
eukprot:TRINITY_DN10283_c0_g1_i1.p1 TRINITY_DN10283_c0_g1~~TRINITY_DN10283_c0_g1_i1.p1  ORF type:complete len:138 (-),score=54.23 TRINITY_DN10283_c0_g1_i1:95-508(-)